MQNYLLEKRLDSEVSEIIFNMGNLLKLLDNQIIQNEPLDDEVFVSRFDYINRIKYLLMLSESIRLLQKANRYFTQGFSNLLTPVNENVEIPTEVFIPLIDKISKSIVKVDTCIKVHNKIILSSFKNVMDKMGYHHVRIQYHLSRIK